MEQIKKYIRGNKERGHEVIAELERLGGKNTLKLKGNEYDKVYYIERYKYTDTNAIEFASEKSFIGQLIVTHPDWEEIELPKYKYPKTYEKCLAMTSYDKEERLLYLLDEFKQLLICRDAYWKIAGEEMGLDTPWEPDWKNVDEKKWVISRYGDELDFGFNIEPFRIFAFPTEEMLYTFYDNFKNEIEQCKELL